MLVLDIGLSLVIDGCSITTLVAYGFGVVIQMDCRTRAIFLCDEGRVLFAHGLDGRHVTACVHATVLRLPDVARIGRYVRSDDREVARDVLAILSGDGLYGIVRLVVIVAIIRVSIPSSVIAKVPATIASGQMDIAT